MLQHPMDGPQSARYGNTEIFKLLAAKMDFNVVTPNGGYAPIHSAARYGYTEIFTYLVSKLENPNPAAQNQNGWTPMHLAARTGQIEIIKILGSILENPNPPKPDGWTPLQLAIHHNKQRDCLGIKKL